MKTHSVPKMAAVFSAATLLWLCPAPLRADPPTATAHSNSNAPALMTQLENELNYSMAHLVAPDGTKPYFINYTVYDEQRAIVSASLGAVGHNGETTDRNLNIDLRVGDYALDNTHQLRGGGRSHASGSGNVSLALDGNPDSIRHALWYHTDRVFKSAARRLSGIKTNLKIKVEEEDSSDDFTREKAHTYSEPAAELSIDRDVWAKRLRRVSALARSHPLVYNSSAVIGAYAGTWYMVSSEGARIRTSQTRYRITLSASTRAEDGMDLSQTVTFNAATVDKLPGEREIAAAFSGAMKQVLALREAPLTEPYIGPAILRNRASGVFFHEIFGHRIEGHRQKDVNEGQTFTKKIDQPVLPPFLSIYDDPTMATFGKIDLRGFFRFDDEGVSASRVKLVENGVLRTFLLSRSPVAGFTQSNGHGRRQPGQAVVSRQGNLIVESTKQVSFDDLRKLLIEECKRQDKEYGLLFEDISGGFTTTSRQGPQSFKVLPIVVYRVYADGRADELIRGADIVGTPLTCFEKITHTGDEPAVFNGTCGAESGWVPVSAISPSVLVSSIEIEKRTRSQNRTPILSPPLAATNP